MGLYESHERSTGLQISEPRCGVGGEAPAGDGSPAGKCSEGNREGWRVWVGRPWPPASSGVPQTAHPSGVLTSHADLQTATPGGHVQSTGGGRGLTQGPPGPSVPWAPCRLMQGTTHPGWQGAGQLPLRPPLPPLEAKCKQTSAHLDGGCRGTRGCPPTPPRPLGSCLVPRFP